MTRWLDHFSILGHLQQRKHAHVHKRLAKVGSIFQILNKPSKNCQGFFSQTDKQKFSKCGSTGRSLVWKMPEV